jgi:hypothetical protein
MRIERGTKVFVDTNVLLEATDEGRRFHVEALNLFRNAAEDGVDLFLGTQVLREYLVVATRPIDNNGLGMTPELALDNVSRFQKKCHWLPKPCKPGNCSLNLQVNTGFAARDCMTCRFSRPHQWLECTR